MAHEPPRGGVWLESCDFYDSVLNVALIAAGPDAPVDKARNFDDAVREVLRKSFTVPSRIEWLDGYPAADDATWAGFQRYYNPLTYACLGAFDVATVYLSPNTGQPRPRANQWPGSGLYLKHAPSSGPREEVPQCGLHQGVLPAVSAGRRPAARAPFPPYIQAEAELAGGVAAERRGAAA